MAATNYDAAIKQLSADEWVGPASTAMSSAVAPYIAWLNTTAASAEHAAAGATAAAAAFEEAFAATVPPPVIATNRAQLAMLVATNVFGQNTAAIMANEAAYAAMWAQDTAAMYGYAGASATAAKVTPFTEPNQTTNPSGISAQGGAVSQAAATGAGNTAQTIQAMSAMPNAIQSLTSPLSAAATTPSSGTSLINSVLNSASMNGIVSLLTAPLNDAMNSAGTAAAFIPSTLLPNMVGYFAGGGFNAIGGGTVGSGLGALLAPGGPLGALGALGGGAASSAAGAAAAAASGVSYTTPVVSAGIGQASLVSSLSVPQTWASTTAAAAPAAGGPAGLAGSGWTAAAPESHSTAAVPPGVPMGSRGGGGFGMPRYGFKPTVMARPVIAG